MKKPKATAILNTVTFTFVVVMIFVVFSYTKTQNEYKSLTRETKQVKEYYNARVKSLDSLTIELLSRKYEN